MTVDSGKEMDAFHHLLRVIVLCQTQRESWTPEDTKSFREAREFVQKHREDISESKREEGSAGVVSDLTRHSESEKVARRVRVEEGSV